MKLNIIIPLFLSSLALSSCATSLSVSPSALVTSTTSIYSAPNSKSARIAKVHSYQKVNLISCRNGTWCYITYNNQHGWIHSSYLNFKRSTRIVDPRYNRSMSNNTFIFSPEPWPAFPRKYLKAYWTPSPFRPVFFR